MTNAPAIPPELFKGKNRLLAAELIAIVGDLRDYWPLTVRQTYYQAVSRLLIANEQREYRKVSRLLTTLRRHDLLPWHAIEDRTRSTTVKRGLSNVGEYIQGAVQSFLNPDYYGRCYIQDQAVYVEVATEKDALASIMSDAVWYFCTRLNIVRGQVSATMVNAMAERFDKAVMLGKRPILLYLGDLDPSGVAIPKALIRNMAEWHSVEVELIRVALNPDQIAAYRLPVELDALHPRDLTAITEAALSSVYDMTSVDAHKAKEREERELLRQMRQRVQDFIAAEWPGVFHDAA